MSDPQERASIEAQTAVKAAVDLYAGGSALDVPDVVTAAASLFTAMQEMKATIPMPAPQAAPPQPTGQAALAQGGIQAQQVGYRDLGSENARWQDALLNNPDDWYNNVGDSRASSGGGRGPDFKFKDDSAEVKPLWLSGKFGDAEEWVFQNLREKGYQVFRKGSQTPQAQAGPPTPQAATADSGQSYGPDEAPF